MNIHAYISKFTTRLKKDGKSDYTIVAYQKDVEQLADYLKEKDIQQISKKDLNNFIKYNIKERGLTKKTTSRKINSFKTFFRFLITIKKLNKNPSEDIAHPEFEHSKPNILSQLEYKAIRDTARSNNRLYTIIELMLQTGLKIGEVSRLKTEDVKINKTNVKLHIEEYQNNAMRIIELNPIAANAMREYIKKRPDRNNDQGYLFSTRTGKNMLIRNIRTALNRVFKRAGVTNIRVNDIRNTFICHQIENGVGLKAIADHVGHKRIASTENYLVVTERKHPGNEREIIPL